MTTRPPRDWIQISVTALPGLAAVIALIFTSLAIRATGAQLQIAEQGQITDRYNAAITNLGSSSVDVRLGGIYALQRIMQDSPRDQPTVVAVLCAFVRDHASAATVTTHPSTSAHKSSAPSQPPTDIQAALTVVGTRNTAHDGSTTVVDLSGAQLHGANLSGAQLPGADLIGAQLAGVQFIRANLTRAKLLGAKLNGANATGAQLNNALLPSANLTNAQLPGANLIGAELNSAQLPGANLTHAYLSGANLTRANLSIANLRGADLTRANLTRANLTFANLRGADLTRANLTGANLADAFLTRANLIGTKGLQTSAPRSPTDNTPAPSAANNSRQ